jgi:hypothetical protein
MFDDQFQKQIAAERSQHERALRGAGELAALLCAFRVQLIVGGFPEPEATEMAREYFEHMLDLRDALSDEDEDEDR